MIYKHVILGMLAMPLLAYGANRQDLELTLFSKQQDLSALSDMIVKKETEIRSFPDQINELFLKIINKEVKRFEEMQKRNITQKEKEALVDKLDGPYAAFINKAEVAYETIGAFTELLDAVVEVDIVDSARLYIVKYAVDIRMLKNYLRLFALRVEEIQNIEHKLNSLKKK
ncbi:MAG: hypothetical protein P4L31_07780 [Candidatus Babeliales bacterium]|nr:hypothetical protein [Candidatus Babeliales bacterium]